MDGSLAVARGAFAAIAHGVPPGTAGQRGAAWLLAETALGAVPESAAELARWREGFAAGLARIEARLQDPGFPPRGSLAAIAAAPFFLAYHGEDDRPLLSRLGDLLARAASRLRPELAAAGQRPPAGRRAAIVSSFLRDCTVGHYFASWIPALRAAGFELCLVQLGPRHDAFTERLGAAAGRLRIVAEGPDALADWLAAERFDLILYPELGMDGRVLAVAALRLAPLQLCAWGHPITSGLPTIDAFLSVGAMEPEQGEAHYRERLLRLPGLGTAYPAPPPPEALDRASLGLPARRPLLFYPHAPFKIHPEDDALLAALAAARPSLAVVLFEGERPSFRARLERRLARAFAAAGADPARQLLWLPLMPRRRFLAVARACDLMLDCLRWSGGNTTLDALSVGLPVLTRPGRFMRGRQSAAMLAMIGADGLVAGSREDLLAQAVRLLDEAELRAAWRARLEAGAPALYGRGEAGPALAAALEGMLADASGPA
ncbi:MAG: hypothetical protein RML12_08195 [Xanthomonadales bacterium]|nr:hypothetical protein [Xanthomonadales bacterium]